MKNKMVTGLAVSAVCVSFLTGGAWASGLNGNEIFSNSLTPSALSQIELPEATIPVLPSILPYPKDSFSYLPACRIIDAKFIKQPTIGESVRMLSGCMEQVSKHYQVTVKAAMMFVPLGGPGNGPQGGTPSFIHITVSGKISAGNPIMEHLEYSLDKRNGRLFGHNVLLSPEERKGMPPPRDAFEGLAGCKILDVLYFTQPTMPEAMRMLPGCLNDVSARYGFPVNAEIMTSPWGGPGGGPQGGTRSISLVVPGNLPMGNQLFSDLNFSLEKRNNRLFGYPAGVRQVTGMNTH